jgi:hypothetical protein
MGTQVLSPAFFDHGSVGAGTSVIELVKGLYQRLTLTAATRTIAAPVVTATSRVSGQTVDIADPVAAGSEDVDLGTVLFIEIKNASGGATTVTWNSAFKGAPGNPANGQRRIFQFLWDGANWVLMTAATDVPN